MRVCGPLRSTVPAAVVVAVLLLWTAPAGAAAEYVRKATWFESMVASLEASRTAVADKALFDRLLADFTDAEDVRQMMIETQAIFAQRVKARPGFRGIAGLYASRCGDEQTRNAATALAAKAASMADLRKVRALFYKSRAAAALKLARATLAYVEAAAERPRMAADLAAVERRIAAAADNADWTALHTDLCRLRRRILFSHPALDFEKLLINKHSPGKYSHNCDQYLGRHSRPGDGLVVLTDWKRRPRATVPLKGKLPRGDMAHPTLSFDARRVIFGFCDHTQRDRRFFIHEATMDGARVRQLTGTPSDPMEGWCGRKTVTIEDFDPAYLPDGGFVFTSTRSQNFGRCHGGRYVPSYLLYRAELPAAGAARNIRQISFAEGNEHFPSVLNDGRIVFTRWEYINRNQIAFHKLWWCRPDGTVSSNFYGANSATPWAHNYHDRHSRGRDLWYKNEPNRHRIIPFVITETRAIPHSRKVVATAMAHHSYTAGTLVIIAPDRGEDGFEPISKLTPETPYPEAEDFFAEPGNYMTPCPVNEELFFAAYSPYRIKKQGQAVPHNEYMVYLVDTLGGREPIYCDPANSCVSPMPVMARRVPPAIPSLLEPDADNTGTLIVQKVYLTRNDPEGIIRRGDIKFLRVNEIISQPRPGPYWAGSREDFARKILGTVPVNPDGSAIFKVPAKTPIHLQALDANGMALLTERNLFHLMPGEVRSCVGCHEKVDTAPLARSAARGQRPRELTPPVGPKYEGGFSFKRTVQPVLDRYCIRCHGLGKTEGRIYLLGNYGPGSRANGMPVKPHFVNSDAYASLTTRPGLLKLALRKSNGGVDSETPNSRPKDYFAHASRLAPMLLTGRMKGKVAFSLDKESRQRIIDWLDLNAIRYGDYSRSKIEFRKLTRDGEKAVRAYVSQCFGPQLAAQPIQALVNVAQIDESRILKAPLALTAGGWGQIAGGWPSTRDPRYTKMLELITAALR